MKKERKHIRIEPQPKITNGVWHLHETDESGLYYRQCSGRIIRLSNARYVEHCPKHKQWEEARE